VVSRAEPVLIIFDWREQRIHVVQTMSISHSRTDVLFVQLSGPSTS